MKKEREFMKKIILVFFLMLLVTGCSDKNVNKSDKNGENILESVEEIQVKSTNLNTPVPIQDFDKSFNSDFESIKEIMSSKKEDVLKKIR